MEETTHDSPLNAALRQFELAEANLTKLEELWKRLAAEMPSGIAFGEETAETENWRRAYANILEHLPPIHGKKPTTIPMDFDDVAQNRLDAEEIGEIECKVSTEKAIEAPGRELRELKWIPVFGPPDKVVRKPGSTSEEFERLIFALVSSTAGYENTEWLMRTNAADRGRDVSTYRVVNDGLGGTIRSRVIIQCKHWQSKSISIGDISPLRDQIKLWEPPRVDVCVIATSGRFTMDAVSWIEKANQSDSALRFEMWPESHLERLLAARPALIATYHLR